MKNTRKSLNILSIGNSHTYYNDMPRMVQRRAADEGFDCRVTMIAHPGWFLEQHVAEPEVRFNILFGNYDYVVLQEHAHPFGPEKKFHDAVTALNEMIQKAGSVPVIYECWARKTEPDVQDHMNEVHRRIANEIGALLAPVGENWWSYQNSRTELEMYAEDGEHASEEGSDFAAKYIWVTIQADISRKQREFS